MSSVSYMKNSKWQNRSMNKCSIAVFHWVQKFSQDEEQILVNAKDRGRLWKVNNDVQNTLSIKTKNFVFELNEVKLIFEAVQNIKLRSYYDNLCKNTERLVDKKPT